MNEEACQLSFMYWFILSDDIVKRTEHLEVIKWELLIPCSYFGSQREFWEPLSGKWCTPLLCHRLSISSRWRWVSCQSIGPISLVNIAHLWPLVKASMSGQTRSVWGMTVKRGKRDIAWNQNQTQCIQSASRCYFLHIPIPHISGMQDSTL